MNKTDRIWPLIEDLPKEEQKPFLEWLRGQTRPVNSDRSVGYYLWDYERWKAGLHVDD